MLIQNNVLWCTQVANCYSQLFVPLYAFALVSWPLIQVYWNCCACSYVIFAIRFHYLQCFIC